MNFSPFLSVCDASESPCLLTTYAVSICILLIGELVAAGLLFHFRNNIAHEVTKGFEKAMEGYGKEGHEIETEAIDGLQFTFKCCGLKSSDEWMTAENHTYPASCCAGFDDKDRTKPCDHPFEKTCLKEVETYFYYVANSAAIAGIIVAIIELVAIVSACLLASTFRKHYNYV